MRALIAAWCVVPDVALADLIDAIGAIAAREVARPDGRTPKEREAAWRALVATGDPAVRGNLYATLRDGDDPELRILSLLADPGARDPRTARALADLLAAKKGVNAYYSYGPKWKPLLVALARYGDARAVARTAEIRAAWRGRASSAGARGRAVAERVDKMLAEIAAAHDGSRAHAQLATADAAIVRTLRAHAALVDKRADDEPALLAAIYAEPTNDGPRAVYADWLLERGDPRGEFIALQLAPEPASGARRCSELLELHKRTWLGTLAPFVELPSASFVRGFPSAVSVHGTQFPPDPAWQTIESVYDQLPASEAQPMPVLREALQLPSDAAIRLAEMHEPPPLEALGISLYQARPPEIDRLLAKLAHLRLPRLASLAISHDGIGADRLGALLAIGPIERLEVDAPADTLAAWLGALATPAALAAPLAIVALMLGGVELNCTRDGYGRFTRLAVHRRRSIGPIAIDRLTGALATLPAGALTAYSFNGAGDLMIKRRRLMVDALARHPGLEITLDA